MQFRCSIWSMCILYINRVHAGIVLCIWFKLLALLQTDFMTFVRFLRYTVCPRLCTHIDVDVRLCTSHYHVYVKFSYGHVCIWILYTSWQCGKCTDTHSENVIRKKSQCRSLSIARQFRIDEEDGKYCVAGHIHKKHQQHDKTATHKLTDFETTLTWNTLFIGLPVRMCVCVCDFSSLSFCRSFLTTYKWN